MSDKIIGLNVTTAGIGGDLPQVNHVMGPQFREKRLFFSEPEIALIIQKNVHGGYGDLEAGTVMAVAAATGLLVPYVPDAIAATDVGRIMLATDNVTATTFKIWKEDVGKITPDDTIVLTDSDGDYEAAAISSVVLDADGRMATVTLSAATTTVGGFTVAKAANCYVLAGAAGKRSDAKYVLDQHLSTGDYTNPNGAHTSVVVSNAVLYKDAMVGADTTALTALNGAVDGPYVILK